MLAKSPPNGLKPETFGEFFPASEKAWESVAAAAPVVRPRAVRLTAPFLVHIGIEVLSNWDGRCHKFFARATEVLLSITDRCAEPRNKCREAHGR